MSPVTAVQNAHVAFNDAADRVTQAAAGLASTDVPAADAPDLAGSMVGLISAQLAYTASAKVLSMQLEHERAVIDLLA